jgi:tetratricopeptide (TPR) repeat protein
VLPTEESEAWEPRARIFEGAALHALGRTDEAARIFGELGARLDGRARRDDLFPSPLAKEWTEAGGGAEIDRLHLAALVHLWRALLALDAEVGDVRVLEELREAHVLFLRSRLVAMRTGAIDPERLDSLFERDLSPHSLILFNQKLAAERGQALDRALSLARAFGQVAPLELMGLEGESVPRRELGDVFFDPERLALLEAMRAAHQRELLRRLEERDPLRAAGDDDTRQRFILRQLLKQSTEDEIEEENALDGKDPAKLSSAQLRSAHASLLDFLTPSMHALALAGELRAENRTSEARALCERALATLRTAPLGSSFFSEYASARFELLNGSTLMDESRPFDAEQVYLAAERRLQAIETQMVERGKAAADPDVARQYEGQARLIRELRGDALLSLAVNANVRMGKPDRALEYFERAYELNQSPFMRILRACYRARSGLADEARTVLRSVVPVPSLYYNIACTHALLGEKAEALDYLERDLSENHPSSGSLAQKKAWARKDPDLASLRGEPRFERMFGERGN